MNDLNKIKKHYGEQMMHFCRESFPTILETEGRLFSILSKHFPYSKFLYEDIINNHSEEEFKKCILFFSNNNNVKYEEDEDIEVKHPKELLDKANYNFYECHSEDDIQSFKKYYAPGEELCTFRGNRLKRCLVFFAVKKDVERIRREDFKNPMRQDEYGTSVISIQFTRSIPNVLSIKNRYNHKVNNPDSTFSNNLDNIIPGLTKSFNKYYNLKTVSNTYGFEMPNYYTIGDVHYKYNFEENGIYYCPNNIIIDKKDVKEFDKSQYLIIDNFVVDLINKKIYPYDAKDLNAKKFTESIGDINSIRVEKDKKTGNKNIIINNDIIIGINSKNQIIKYINNKVKEIGDNFLNINNTLEYLELNNVEHIGDNFLHNNNTLRELHLSKVIEIGNDCLNNAIMLENVDMLNVKSIGERFANKNSIKILYLPELQELGEGSFENSSKLEELELSKLIIASKTVFHDATNLRILNIPNVEKIEFGAFTCVDSLETINADNLKEIEDMVFRNIHIKRVNFPSLVKVSDSTFPLLGNNFLFRAKDSLEEAHIPNIDSESFDKLRNHVKEAIIRSRKGVK